MRFWDASAIVPLLVDEPQSGRMLGLFRTDPHLVVWWATTVECVAAVARREREGALDSRAATSALNRLDRLARRWDEVQPVADVRSAARRLLQIGRAHV